MKRRGLTQGALAEMSKLGQGYISELSSGKKQPSWDSQEAILAALDLSHAQFYAYDALDCDDYGLVRKIKAKVSAGTGSLETNEEVKGFYAFRRDFFARLGASEDNLVLVDVMGDSMMPTLHPRDCVLVDLTLTESFPGDLVAVRIDEDILVKRLDKKPGRLVLKSDNAVYDDIEIDLSIENQNLAIIGRVRWLGRMIR